MRAFEKRKKDGPANTSFFAPKIQKKLKTGTAGDQFEVEADRVADKVVNNNMSGGGLLQSKEDVQEKPISDTISSVQAKDVKEEEPVQKKSDKKEEEKAVQKKEKDEEKPIQKKSDKKEEEKPVQKKAEEKDKPVQKKTDKKEEEKPVQKKADTNEGFVQKKEEKEPASDVENNLKKGGGNPLDQKTQQEMEHSLGVDFSSIRIHTDENAVKMCQKLGAQAFTNGVNIYFNKGKYNPNSSDGKKLLAHELTHTIQQGAIKK